MTLYMGGRQIFEMSQEVHNARSRSLYDRISKYITGTDRRTVRVLTVTHPYNTVYAVKYRFFARILTPLGAQTQLIY
jgi:hypothetical protein